MFAIYLMDKVSRDIITPETEIIFAIQDENIYVLNIYNPA